MILCPQLTPTVQSDKDDDKKQLDTLIAWINSGARQGNIVVHCSNINILVCLCLPVPSAAMTQA